MNPPKGVCTRTELFELTRDDSRLERPRHPQPPRAVSRPDRAREPKGVSFAIPIASASPENGMTAATGLEDLLAGDALVVRRLHQGAREPVPRDRPGASPRNQVARPRRMTRRFPGAPTRSAAPSLSPSAAGSPTLTRGVASTQKLQKPVVDRALHEDPRAASSLAGVAEERRTEPSPAARSRSASPKMTFADLPPSSSVTRLIEPAAPRMTSRPTSVEPVKAILATSGCSTSRWPTTEPGPTTTLRTPSGIPASSASSASRKAESGVSSAGLSTTVFPQASAGPSFQLAMLSGKFQGTISPTTPSASRNVAANAARGRDRLAEMLVDRAGVVVEDLGDHADLAACPGDRLPDVL